ncbi:MAG: right-handed parallel beta-helix repeat-containing protein [Actinomycetota bacterium]
MRTTGTRLVAALGAGLALAMIATTAFAHAERETEFPDGTGEVPTYRPMIATPNLVVCKDDSRARIRDISDRKLRAINLRLLRRCDYSHIQDAVFDLKRRGSTIYILPGVYEEDPYRATPKCAANLAQDDGEGKGDEESQNAPVLTYEEQLECPHAQNLIGIFGDTKPTDDKRECNSAACDLQLEGTGDDPEDVVITGGFKESDDWLRLNGIRADRADGIYFKNFTIELFEFNAIYVLETDGFVIDEVVARYNDEYGFLTFAVDHGLYKNCEAYNTGDAGLYPGSASDVNTGKEEYGQVERWAVEIDNCSSHHNASGYSGTAGNSVYVHDTDFHHNALGLVTDSVFPNHPGLPQDHGLYENNRIYSNNINYFDNVHDGTCDKPPAERGYKPLPTKPLHSGIVCPVGPYPVGTGMIIAGGNWNLFRNNRVWDNWRAGLTLISVPAAVREEYDPTLQFDTSHFNKIVDNIMGIGPDGKPDLNGVDFFWDDNGEGNCWQENTGAGEDDATSHNAMDPRGLPDCESGGSMGVPVNPYKQGPMVPCVLYDRSDPIFRDPPGCDFYNTPEEPE